MDRAKLLAMVQAAVGPGVEVFDYKNATEEERATFYARKHEDEQDVVIVGENAEPTAARS